MVAVTEQGLCAVNGQELPPGPGKTGWPWMPSRSVSRSQGASSWPRWTLVIPSLNHGSYIEEAIRSVLMQHYPDLELIVMDGGSTDETVNVLRRYEPSLAHWESCADRGQSHAINKGFERATGEILSFLNSDDVLLPGAAFRGVSALDVDNEAGIAYGNTQVFAGHEQVAAWKMQAFSRRTLLHRRGPVVFHVPFIKRSVYESCGGFNEQLHFAFDYEYACRLMRAGVRAAVVDDYIAKFRVHSTSKTSGSLHDTRYYDEEARICSEYGGPWFNYARRTSLRIRARAAVECSPFAFALSTYRRLREVARAQ
jgi:glycosyltransferase involved in cell wall biosynthesis